MTAIETIFGIMSRPMRASTAALTASSLALNDADNSVAHVVCLIKDGTITKVGFLVTALNGSPPSYNVGLVTVDASGNPTTTPYGGSAITGWVPAATGWNWITLSTPATANAGDFCAIRIYPGLTPPDGSNNISVGESDLIDGSGSTGNMVFPNSQRFTTSWLKRGGSDPIALSYNDGTIMGYSVDERDDYAFNTTSTPDEVGNLFTAPFTFTCNGAILGLPNWSSGATCQVILYDSLDNVLKSVTIGDEDYLGTGDSFIRVYWDNQILTSGSQYRIVLKTTTGAGVNFNICYFDFDVAGDRACVPDGTTFQGTSRSDAGAWTDTSLRLYFISPLISDISVGGGGAFAYWYAG